MSSKKTAIFLTGAAARISQEVAILDKLMSEKGLQPNEDDTLLAGFSSGSLNLAALNSCFKKEAPNSWNKYYKAKVLFPLKTDQVYKFQPSRKSLLDTKPLRKTLDKFLDKMKCEYFGDFSFEAFVMAYSREDKDQHTHWANSKNKLQGNLKASDLFMASTAIPVLFPEQEIRSRVTDRDFPYGDFRDGGTQGTFKYFEKYMDEYIAKNGSMETMHVISPMRQSPEQESKFMLKQMREMQSKSTLEQEKADGILEDIKDFLTKISMNSFLKFLYALQEWNKENVKIKNVYVSIPEMEKNYPIIFFGKQRKQYKAVKEWLELNPDKLAVPLDVFLEAHPLE